MDRRKRSKRVMLNKLIWVEQKKNNQNVWDDIYEYANLAKLTYKMWWKKSLFVVWIKRKLSEGKLN